MLSKVMESIINSQLLVYPEDHFWINGRQLALCRRRSTNDILVYLSHLWAAAFKSKKEGLVVSLNMAKALDRVWHGALTAFPIIYVHK